ncbi:unnamed protein product [Sphagnum tenellum]
MSKRQEKKKKKKSNSAQQLRNRGMASYWPSVGPLDNTKAARGTFWAPALMAIVAPAFNSDHLNYVLPWLFLHPGQVHEPEIAQKSGACTVLR